MTWHVWTDGSCQHGYAQAPKRTGGWGGWAAVVEHGSEGVVVRGRVPDTTNVRMELVAATEGLRAVPDGQSVTLHTDCTTILAVRDKWRDGGLRVPERGRTAGRADASYWHALARELERVTVTVVLIVKGDRDPVHRRAHVLAGAEARGGLRRLPANAVPLEPREGLHRLRKHLQREARLLHLPACRPGACASACPVWLRDGAAVYASRRRSEAARP